MSIEAKRQESELLGQVPAAIKAIESQLQPGVPQGPNIIFTSNELCDSFSVTPGATTKYTLRASGPGGTDSKSIVVVVYPADEALDLQQAYEDGMEAQQNQQSDGYGGCDEGGQSSDAQDTGDENDPDPDGTSFSSYGSPLSSNNSA